MLPVARPSLPSLERYVALLEQIWETRQLSNFGTFAQLFEMRAQAYLGNPFVRCAASCDLGLIVSIAALGLPDGASCLVPSFTFNSTINAILWNRLRPIFVDCDPATFNIDVRDVRRRLRKVGAAAIVGTHIFGSPLDLDALLKAAREAGARVVVDAAHAFGSVYRGRRIGVGGLGDFQVFSFSGTKQVTTAEGALVAASGLEDAGRIEKLRAYGFRWDYVSEMVGLNGKLSELHAALGTLLIGDVEDVVARRNVLASRYRAGLSSIAGLAFQSELPETRSTFKDFAILCPALRDELSAHLGQLGVQTKKYFRPLHGMPAYARFTSPDDDLVDTEAVYSRILCLPIFNELGDDDVDRVCDVIRSFYGVR
jgi:dTDP-4-amino-4,6-dideoxy-D-glucose transaminase